MSGLDFETILQLVMAVVALYLMYVAFTKDPF